MSGAEVRRVLLSHRVYRVRRLVTVVVAVAGLVAAAQTTGADAATGRRPPRTTRARG